jgi:hypothetical protein
MTHSIENNLASKRRLGAIFIFALVYIGALVIIFAPQGSFTSKGVAAQNASVLN